MFQGVKQHVLVAVSGTENLLTDEAEPVLLRVKAGTAGRNEKGLCEDGIEVSVRGLSGEVGADVRAIELGFNSE